MVEILSVFVLCFTAIAATQDNDATATMEDEMITNKDLIIYNLQQENANLHIYNGNLHIKIGNLEIENGNVKKENLYLIKKNSNCTIEIEDDDSSCNETFSLFVTQSKGNFDEVQQKCIAGGGELLNWKLMGFGPVGTKYFSEIQKITDQYSTPLYIGLTDRGEDGKWKWMDGTAYQPDLDVDQLYKWRSGEPQNDDGDHDYNQDCAVIYNEALYDNPCTAGSPYGLCQKQLTSCP